MPNACDKVMGSPSSSSKRKVVFKDLIIRTYRSTLGDHPECKFGPPISIDWDYIEENKISLDEYEAVRSPRRSPKQMQLPSYVRKRVLREQWGIPAEELVEAAKEARRIQKLRQRSNALIFLSPLAEFIENVRDFHQWLMNKFEMLKNLIFFSWDVLARIALAYIGGDCGVFELLKEKEDII